MWCHVVWWKLAIVSKEPVVSVSVLYPKDTVKRSSETSVHIHWTTQHYIPEDGSVPSDGRRNIKTCVKLVCCVKNVLALLYRTCFPFLQQPAAIREFNYVITVHYITVTLLLLLLYFARSFDGRHTLKHETPSNSVLPVHCKLISNETDRKKVSKLEKYTPLVNIRLY
jgi:hypothetical protein